MADKQRPLSTSFEYSRFPLVMPARKAIVCASNSTLLAHRLDMELDRVTVSSCAEILCFLMGMFHKLEAHGAWSIQLSGCLVKLDDAGCLLSSKS